MSLLLKNSEFLEHMRGSKAKTKQRMNQKMDRIIDRVYGQVLADLDKFFMFDGVKAKTAVAQFDQLESLKQSISIDSESFPPAPIQSTFTRQCQPISNQIDVPRAQKNHFQNGFIDHWAIEPVISNFPISSCPITVAPKDNFGVNIFGNVLQTTGQLSRQQNQQPNSNIVRNSLSVKTNSLAIQNCDRQLDESTQSIPIVPNQISQLHSAIEWQVPQIRNQANAVHNQQTKDNVFLNVNSRSIEPLPCLSNFSSLPCPNGIKHEIDDNFEANVNAQLSEQPQQQPSIGNVVGNASESSVTQNDGQFEGHSFCAELMNIKNEFEYDSETTAVGHLQHAQTMNNLEHSQTELVNKQTLEHVDQFSIDHKDFGTENCPWDNCLMTGVIKNEIIEPETQNDGSNNQNDDLGGQMNSKSNQETIIGNTTFANQPVRRRHSKAKPIPNKPFKCPLCPRWYANKVVLHGHLRAKHAGTRMYKCSHCGIRCISEIKLEKHIRIIHIQKRTFECEQCGKLFARRNGLKVHLEKSHNKKKKQNLIQSNGNKRNHLVRRCPKQTRCPYCARVFVYRLCLLKHLRIHRNPRLYQCGQCEKTFKWKSNLVQHQAIHRSRQFKCGYCDKWFSYACNRLVHERAVHLRIRFQCNWPDCHFSASHRSVVIKHVRVLHLSGQQQQLHTKQQTDDAQSYVQQVSNTVD